MSRSLKPNQIALFAVIVLASSTLLYGFSENNQVPQSPCERLGGWQQSDCYANSWWWNLP